MRVAFVGKGGSGKTTLSSLLVRHLAGEGLTVIAIDADINQHLAEALGAPGQPPAMGSRLAEIKEYLRGDNPRIPAAAAMVKTPPRPRVAAAALRGWAATTSAYRSGRGPAEGTRATAHEKMPRPGRADK